MDNLSSDKRGPYIRNRLYNFYGHYLTELISGGIYKDSPRVNELISAIDPRKSLPPQNIAGVGRMYEKTFWLDVKPR